MPTDLIDISTVCALTGLHRTTIYRLRSRGDFPIQTLLGTRCARWVASEVDAWLRERDPLHLHTATPAD